MDYGQYPLTRDAAQRAAKHLYLEEEIARHERGLMLSELGSASTATVASFDPVKIQVMTSLQPEYVWRIQDAVNSGLDVDVEGVFT